MVEGTFVSCLLSFALLLGMPLGFFVVFDGFLGGLLGCSGILESLHLQ